MTLREVVKRYIGSMHWRDSYELAESNNLALIKSSFSARERKKDSIRLIGEGIQLAMEKLSKEDCLMTTVETKVWRAMLLHGYNMTPEVPNRKPTVFLVGEKIADGVYRISFCC